MKSSAKTGSKERWPVAAVPVRRCSGGGSRSRAARGRPQGTSAAGCCACGGSGRFGCWRLIQLQILLEGLTDTGLPGEAWAATRAKSASCFEDLISVGFRAVRPGRMACPLRRSVSCQQRRASAFQEQPLSKTAACCWSLLPRRSGQKDDAVEVCTAYTTSKGATRKHAPRMMRLDRSCSLLVRSLRACCFLCFIPSKPSTALNSTLTHSQRSSEAGNVVGGITCIKSKRNEVGRRCETFADETVHLLLCLRD